MFSPAFIVLYAVIFFLSSCKSEEPPQGFLLTGKLENAAEGKIYLMGISSAAVVPLDTASVGRDGTFSLRHTGSGMGFYRLQLAPDNFINLVLDSTDTVNITADARSLYYTCKVDGPGHILLLQELNEYLGRVNTRTDSLRRMYTQFAFSPPDDPGRASLNEEFNRLMEEKRRYIHHFIEKNYDSFTALAAVEQLDPNTDAAYYVKVDNALFKKYSGSPLVKNFHAKVVQFARLAPGATAPEIILPDPSGNPVALSSLRGKIVLVDFWASWCKPCRIENPNVVRLYKKFHSYGFEIFGVSLDRSKEAWLAAIRDDGLEWIHVSDLLFWNSPVVKLYDIQGIPQTFLIDKNGIIIAKGLRGEALESKLEEIIASF